MRFVAACALVLAATDIHAAPTPAGMRLELRDTITVAHPGATAAFSIDPTVAEASVSGGQVTIVARGVGVTTISIVTAASIDTLALTVVPPPPWLIAQVDPALARHFTIWQGGYESSSARLTNSLEMVDRTDQRTLRAYAVSVVRLDAHPGDTDPTSSIPALSLGWRGHDSEVVLFDKLIEHSALTLDRTTVRGVHVMVGGLELHAGVTSPLLYQDVFLSTQREIVLGASYELRSGTSSFTPSVYAYPSPAQTGGTEGAMGSLQYRYASLDERLKLRSELGWGGVLGAAGDLEYRGDTQRVSISARHQPRGFAALGIGRPLGSTIDVAWSGEASKRLAVQAFATAARYDIGAQQQDVATGSTEARLKLTRHLAASLGASAGRFSGDLAPVPVRTLTLPAGLYLDGRTAGVSAVYRYELNTASNHGGHGGRLAAHASLAALHLSAFVDAQQDVATLALVLRAEPLLAQTLNELGLTATGPDDLARLLRDNATLAQLGYVTGGTLELDPWRAQVGGELAWLPQGPAREQIRLRVLVDRRQTITDREDTRSASLSYARGIGAAVDVTGMASAWSRDGLTDWSVAAGIRVRVGAVPHLPSWQHHDITGRVTDELGAPVAGVMIQLDGGRPVPSDATGHFAFSDVTGTDHRVEAALPDDTYFTTPSRVAVEAGGTAQFGISRAPAHAIGAVVDDRGVGIAGISIALHGAKETRATTTDSRGDFRFAAAPGDYALEVAPESIPAGYDAASAPRQIRLVAGTAVESTLVMPAHRSVAGRLHGAGTVTLVELDRTGTVDAAGRYVFRSLSPGTYTVEATIGGTATRRTVVVPDGPAAIRDIDFP